MTRIESWWLRRLLAREVRQGGHVARIKGLYWAIRDAAGREFFEDNEATRDDYLREWFESTQHSGRAP